MSLSTKLRTTVSGNLSLLVVVFGALSNFVLILLLKKFLPDTFNTYSLYLTFLGIIVSFGLLGFDQVMLRLAGLGEGKIAIPKDVFIALLLSGITVPIIIGYYFSTHYQHLPLFLLIISGVGINSMIFSFNILRLKKKFIIAQFFQNGYKIVFLLSIALFFILRTNSLSINDLILISTVIIAILAGWSIYSLLQNLTIIPEKSDAFINYFISFSMNMALLTLLSYGERLLIVNELGEDAFGKYFYYSTVFLFPLTLIQYYVGFKELVYFKEKRDTRMLHSKIKKIFLGGLVLIAMVFLTVYIDNNTFLSIDIKNNIWLIVLLSGLGIAKLIYGLFSALLGAVAEYRDMYIINLITFVLMGVSLLVLFSVGVRLERVVVALIGIFMIRSIFIYSKYA